MEKKRQWGLNGTNRDASLLLSFSELTTYLTLTYALL